MELNGGRGGKGEEDVLLIKYVWREREIFEVGGEKIKEG